VSLSKNSAALLRDFLLTGTLPPLTPSLVGTAREQGLSAHILAAIEAAPGLTPPALRDLLREDSRIFLRDGIRKLEAAGKTLALLDREGIRALPLKGAALAESLYASVAERPMADVDLLVLDSFPDAVRALEKSHYRVGERASHAWALHEPELGVTVELHKSLTSCPGLFPTHPGRLWGRSLPGTGPISRRPGFEDLLLQLALHASFQHGLVLSLVQWLDLRRLLERPSLDLEVTLRDARELRAGPALASAMLAATAVVGASIPAPHRAELDSWLPRSVRRWLGNPMMLITPTSPRLARIRWDLAAGRRLDLIRETFGTAEGGGMARAARLVRRFGPAFFS
jgi:hypothetical protein